MEFSDLKICVVGLGYVGLPMAVAFADKGVKVIGFDGVTSGSYTTPALSTIQVDFTQLAKFSVDMLSERIDHGTDEALPPRRAIIGYQLVGIDRGLRMTPRWQAIRHRQQPSRPIPLNRNHSIGINRHHSSRNL